MSALINIPSTVNDPQYRYKMPELVTKIEGSGNGIKTCIVNMSEVAQALKCPPEYTVKFLGCELAAQSTFKDDRAIIMGVHDVNMCQKKLDKFIDSYVLCQNCHLPEIDMYVKNKTVKGACKACGWRGDLDNEHRLATFIQRNPPDGGIGFDSEKVKMDKKERQRLRAEKQRRGGASEDGDDVSGGSGGKEVKEKKEKKVKKEKKDKKENKSMNAGKRDDDNDSEVDKRKKEKKDKKEKNDKKPHKKVEEQNQGMSMAVNGRGVDEDSEVEELQYDSDEIQDVIKTLSEFVASTGGNPAVALFLEELRMQQLAKIFDNKVRLYVAIQALFGTTIPAKEIPGKAKYLTKVIQNGNMSPQDILWGFEVYLVNNPATEKQYPRTLKGLYDADIVTEEQLLEHYKGDFSTPGFATAKKAAKPFLDWLEQESEASDSDEN